MPIDSGDKKLQRTYLKVVNKVFYYDLYKQQKQQSSAPTLLVLFVSLPSRTTVPPIDSTLKLGKDRNKPESSL